MDDSDLWAEGGPDGKRQRLRPLYEVLELMRGPVFPMARQLCGVLATDRAPEIFKIVPGHYAEQVTEATEWEGVSNVGPRFWHDYKGKAQKTSYTVHLPPSHGQVRLGIDQHDNAPSRPAMKDVLRGREGVLEALGRWIAERQKDGRGELVTAMKGHSVFGLLAVREADVAVLIGGEVDQDGLLARLAVGADAALSSESSRERLDVAAPASVVSIAAPRVGSRPQTRDEKEAAQRSAIEAIRPPQRTQQGQVCWTAPQTCVAFLDAFNGLQRAGMKQDAALDEIARAWSTEGNSLKGSSLKKRRTECGRSDPRQGEQRAA